ncbi:MAG: hypothetical protein JSS02_03085 [Planctomycetes bacterium]|nr:hypothetical protein [Planctomycetota bacterium]
MILAQTAAPSTAGMWMVGIAAGLAVLLVTMTFLVLLFRYLSAARQLTHAERMRSLEAGLPMQAPEEAKIQAKFLYNAFWISFWLVVAVPAAAFSAVSFGAKPANESVALSIVIWSGATLASIAAVVCATVLMLKSRPRKTDDPDGPRRAANPGAYPEK